VRFSLFEQASGLGLEDADRVSAGRPAQRRVLGADELDQRGGEFGGVSGSTSEVSDSIRPSSPNLAAA
jgi:hypothetical protein